jgi:hypothetical protein
VASSAESFPSATALADSANSANRSTPAAGLWLFSRRTDLTMMLVPLALAVIAGVVLFSGGGAGARVFGYWGWVAQYVFGNTTHVILTFLLLASKRDVLTAAPGQARVVIVGSILTFAATSSFFYLCSQAYPQFSDLGIAFGLVFSLHHSMSQTKGLWSLYNLRAGQQGRPPATPRERGALQHFVAFGLLLATIRAFFVAKDARPGTYAPPFINVLPGEPAFLPHATMYVLLGLWLVFAAYTLASLVGGAGPANRPKTLYVAMHLALVALVLLSPGWGVVTKGAVHGLEYFLLCGRMLQPAEGEGSRLSPSLVWPAMLLAALPIFAVGMMSGPFSSWVPLPRDEKTIALAVVLTNGLVMSHYFADAFIYRFRIPEVRRVALRRLGFG